MMQCSRSTPRSTYVGLLSLFLISSAMFGAQEDSSLRQGKVTLEWHRVELDAPCFFFTRHGVIWSAEFRDGSTLSVVCTFPLPFRGPQLRLRYRDSRGQALVVGRCIFATGCNDARFCIARSGNNVPFLLETEWQSVDGGKNDGRRRITKSSYTGPEEPYLDSVTWNFQPTTGTLRWVNEKYEYLVPVSQLVGVAGTCAVLSQSVGAKVDRLTRSGTEVRQ
jgi:hypothetical protein